MNFLLFHKLLWIGNSFVHVAFKFSGSRFHHDLTFVSAVLCLNQVITIQRLSNLLLALPTVSHVLFGCLFTTLQKKTIKHACVVNNFLVQGRKLHVYGLPYTTCIWKMVWYLMKRRKHALVTEHMLKVDSVEEGPRK